MAEKAYSGIRVLSGIYISSSGHYSGVVFWVRGGRRWKHDVELPGVGIFAKVGFDCIKTPQYVETEIRRQFLALLTKGATYYEYDRDGNPRFENLRYHSQEVVAWIIECLKREASHGT